MVFLVRLQIRPLQGTFNNSIAELECGPYNFFDNRVRMGDARPNNIRDRAQPTTLLRRLNLPRRIMAPSRACAYDFQMKVVIEIGGSELAKDRPRQLIWNGCDDFELLITSTTTAPSDRTNATESTLSDL